METGMDAKLQTRVQRYGWDKAAAHYDRTWREQLAPAQEAVLRMAEPVAGRRILDVACGTGAVAISLAERGGAEIVGVDLSAEMISAVSAAANERSLSGARFERMNAERLNFADETFDLTICSLGLMYCPDPEKALCEMHRVTKPGGRIVCAVWGPRRECGWAEIFPIADARVKSEVCPMFFRLGEAGALARAISEAGYRAVAAEIVETRLVYGDPKEACAAAFLGGPVALAYSRFNEEEKEAAHSEYLDSIQCFRVGDAFRVPGVFVIAAGEK